MFMINPSDTPKFQVSFYMKVCTTKLNIYCDAEAYRVRA